MEAMLAHSQPLGAPDCDWNWPVYEYQIPLDWESGAYIALFVSLERENTCDPADPHQREAGALFVVRSRRAANKILYKLPIFTYHAYNEIGDPCGSLYTGGYQKVTLRRPGGGIGGQPWDHYFPDVYDLSSPRQTFWHWDVPSIRWLEGRRFPVDYCTDLDIHENPENFLDAYRLLLSVGHDEYWSEAMRRHVSAFVEHAGGNVAFLSGNVCWWRAHLVEGNTLIVCDKRMVCGRKLKRDQWFRFDPENRLTGVSHRNGGAQWWDKREAIGYTVQHADHWVFAGTGLRDGDTFGADHALVGYECDGAAISDQHDERGFAVPSHNDDTPENFIILGTARLGPEWAQDPADFPGGRTATMGIYANNGVVFTAATTDWARVLASGDPYVEKITENILRHLGAVKYSENVETNVTETVPAALSAIGRHRRRGRGAPSMTVARVASPQYAAVRAWNKLFSKTSAPNSVEVLQEVKKGNSHSCIYRLNGVGPGGTSVIAKRSAARCARVEHTIYDEILRLLPISSLSCYGCVDEPETEYGWLFLEDAGGDEFANSIEEHRRLAARWLGRMHVSAARVPASSRLPDRGPQHYLDHLRFARQIIQRNLDDSALTSHDLQVVEDVLSQGHLLESRWDRVEELCHRFPRTLVHGDFAQKNFRMRSTDGGIDLLAFDWEMAGYGIPAPDIAELSGRGVPRRRVDRHLPDTELLDYWSVVRESWSDLGLTGLQELAELGAMFRLLAAISWESESIPRWWPIIELHGYQTDLAIALEQLGFAR